MQYSNNKWVEREYFIKTGRYLHIPMGYGR